MNNRISVCIFKREDRPYYEAQWKDPVTGKKKTKSTGKSRESDARRVAAVIENELQQGNFQLPSRVT